MLSPAEKDSQHRNNQLGYLFIQEFVIFLFSHALRIKGVGGLRATPALAERRGTRPASPRIFEHLQNGIITHFKRIFTLKKAS